jgi:type III secretory pathway component EscU
MAGRPKGSKNKRSALLMGATSEAVEVAMRRIPNAFKGDAHAFLCILYKDEDQPMPVRIDAAKAAIAYEKPKLQSTALTSPDGSDLAIKHSVIVEYIDPK